MHPAVSRACCLPPAAVRSTLRITAHLIAPFQLFAFSNELCRLVVTDASWGSGHILSLLHSRFQPEACQLMLPLLLAQLREFFGISFVVCKSWTERKISKFAGAGGMLQQKDNLCIRCLVYAPLVLDLHQNVRVHLPLRVELNLDSGAPLLLLLKRCPHAFRVLMQAGA